MAEAYGSLNGSGPQQIWIKHWRVSQSASGNYSTFRIQVVYVANGYGSWTNNNQSWSASVNGSGGKSWSGTFKIPSPGTSNITLLDTTYNKTHDSSGNLAAFTASASINTDHSSIGDGSVSVSEPAAPRIAKAPGQVTGLNVTEPTASGFKATWSAPSNNGSSIIRYDIDYATKSDFSNKQTTTSTTTSKTWTSVDDATEYYVRVRAVNSASSPNGAYSATDSIITIPDPPTGVTITNPSTVGMTVTWVAPGPEVTGYELDYSSSSDFAGAVTVQLGNVLTHNLTGLTPGTSYYVRVRAKNGSGEGLSSSTANQTTLPAVPPGLTVVASPDGKQATLTFTPPGGSSGVTKYTWERRPTPAPQTPVVTGDTTTAVAVVTGLTPGNQNDWRGSAWFGTYQSPWTNWVTVQQPKPNTNPGDYFDGSTPDTEDEDYAWTGAVNNSPSTVTAKTVLGWGASFSNGASGVLYHVTGGWDRDKAARVLFHTNATAEGAVEAGMDPAHFAAVAGGATYFGSVYVMPDAPQSLAAKVIFYNAAGVEVGEVVGPATETVAGEWTRLVAEAPSPTTAARAVTVVTDIAGASWHLWRGGDGFIMDAAMVTLGELFPYFDGDTPNTSSYTYEWEGIPDESESTRTPVTISVTDPLADPDCPPVPLPPRPPAVPADCIDEIGVWRRYWAAIPAEAISDWLAVIPTITIETGAEEARQVRIRIYENPDNIPANEFQSAEWVSEQIISYMPPSTLVTLDGVSRRVWAEVGGGGSLPADKLLYGTGGTPATWPILSCGIGYLLAFDAPLEGATGNITVGLALTERAG